jgi:hypothetical protein
LSAPLFSQAHLFPPSSSSSLSATALQKALAALEKQNTAKEATLEQLRSTRHDLMRRCKLEVIELPIISQGSSERKSAAKKSPAKKKGSKKSPAKKKKSAPKKGKTTGKKRKRGGLFVRCFFSLFVFSVSRAYLFVLQVE